MIRGLRVPVHLSSREALRIFDLADIWAARTRNAVRLVSANDHVHSGASRHYAGLAVDLHTTDPEGLSRALRGAGYRVLWNVPGHYAHVHVEQDAPLSTHGRALRPPWGVPRNVMRAGSRRLPFHPQPAVRAALP